MPSPFPGVDPYLEKRKCWPDFHAALFSEIRAQLNRALPNGYAAFIDERIYVLTPESPFIPDITVSARQTVDPASHGRTAVLERPTDEPETVGFHPNTQRELYVEVRRFASGQGAVVSTLELLSPPNKHVGGAGRAKYLEKQWAMLESETHLLEIDLLRSGAHTVAANRADVFARGHWDYLICLHRG
ncbi:MAG TPA: DUF4058 family protein [Chthonomonadaceae bacterium]|nr:DUF4058 family protein [Chthonomonadaceae bacterium]